MKKRKKQQEEINEIDRRLDALSRDYQAALAELDKDLDEQRRVITRRFTEYVKSVHAKKAMEVKKWRSLRDAAIRNVEKQYETMLSDLHGEFAQSFNELEVGYKRQVSDAEQDAARAREKREVEFDTRYRELVEQRRSIVDAGEKREKERAAKVEAAKPKLEQTTNPPAMPVPPPAR